MARRLLTSLMMLILLTVVLGFGYPLLVTGISLLGFNHQANGSLVHKSGKLVGSALLGQSFTNSAGEPLVQYFQPRTSDAGSGYNAASSGASNLGPSNPLLIGFVAGVNTIGLDGKASSTNPFTTTTDPACVPVDLKGNPVTSPTLGERFAKNSNGSYVCDPNTVPERAIAYRSFNGLGVITSVPIDAVTASGSGLDPDISIANAILQAGRVARVRHLPRHEVINLVHRYTEGRQLGFLGEPVVNVLELNLALDRIR
jgi:K+-transporting ATPase ATPase C chain